MDCLSAQHVQGPLVILCKEQLEETTGDSIQLSQVADHRYFTYLRRLLYRISNNLCDDLEIDKLLDAVMQYGYRPALKGVLAIQAVSIRIVCEAIIPNLLWRRDIELFEHIRKSQPSICKDWYEILGILFSLRGNPETHPPTLNTDPESRTMLYGKWGQNRRYYLKESVSICLRHIFQSGISRTSLECGVNLLAAAILAGQLCPDNLMQIFDYESCVDKYMRPFATFMVSVRSTIYSNTWVLKIQP